MSHSAKPELEPVDVEALLDDARACELTPDDLRWIGEQHARGLARLDAIRQLARPERPVLRGVHISRKIRALPRGTVISRLKFLTRGGSLLVAHDGMTELTDNDLRQTLAVVLADDSHEE